MMRNALRYSLLAASIALSPLMHAQHGWAAESGTSFYLLGSRGPMAGMTPPPGVYLQNDTYYYKGSASKGVDFEFGGKLVGNVDAKALINLSTILWVTEQDILGGNLSFTATVPIGGPEINGYISPGPFSRSDNITTIGDPVLGAFIGWHEGDFHWQTGVSTNVPVGNYEEGALANVSFNHWATDVYAAGTWLNPETGLELSGAVGLTFNGENPATNYRNGTEIHFEGTIDQHFSKAFDLGLIGYFYQQLSPDTGSGVPPIFDGFEGRVAALGLTAGYTFQAGQLPVSARIKYFHEFSAKNRLEGDSVFLTISMPLAVNGH